MAMVPFTYIDANGDAQTGYYDDGQPDPNLMGPQLPPDPNLMGPQPDPNLMGPQLPPDPNLMGPQLPPDPNLMGPQLPSGSTGTGTGTTGTPSTLDTLLNYLKTNGAYDPKKIAGVMAGIGGVDALTGGKLLGGLTSSVGQPVGYLGGIPKYSVSRSRLAVPALTPADILKDGMKGREYFGDTVYTKKASGGILDVYAKGGPTRNAPRYLQGGTDGMADQLEANIDGKHPAKLSHGEFVVPADVVSHLGNGNSDAGAKKLYSMMDKIRMARTGTKKQGKQINPDKFMPGGLAKFAAGGTVPGYAGTTGSTVTAPTTTTPTGTTGVESSLSNWAGPYVTDMLGQAQALAAEPYQAYTGPLTAGASALQQTGFNQAANLQVPASIGQAAQTAGDIGNRMQTLSYSPANYGITYQGVGPYSGTQFGSTYQGTAQYNPVNYGSTYQSTAPYQTGAFGNQFASPGVSAATNFSNTYQGTSPYQTGTFGNQYQGTGAYQAGAFGNQYQGTGPYQTGTFSNQYQGIGPYQAGSFTNQFSAPTGAATQATNFTNQFAAPGAYQGSNITSGTFGTQQAAQYMNPYLQSALSPQLDEMRRQAQITQTGNDAKMTQAGAFGGSRQALMNTETQRNLMSSMESALGTGFKNAYDAAASQFNADQGRSLTAQQANEQSRQFGANQAMTAAQLQAQYGLSAQQAQEAARQFNSGQAMTAAQLQAQYGLSAQQAAEASRQFGYGQAANAAQLQAQYGQSAQQAQEASRQFGANLGLSNAQNAAQYGLAGLQAAEASRQFGANLGLSNAQNAAQYGLAGLQATEASRQFGANQASTAAQLQAQYGLSAQQAQEAARQFNQGQTMTAAQLQAQYGLSAQQAQEASRQFGAAQGATNAQNAAQYAQAANALNAQNQQFGANLGIQNALNAAQFGQSANALNAQQQQFGANLGIQNALNAAQYGQAANTLNSQNQQFGANYGLQALQAALQGAQTQGSLGVQQGQQGIANLNAILGAGATQRDIVQQGYNADQAAFNAARDNPYKMLQFQQSMLQGLPISTQQYSQAQPSVLQQLSALGASGAQISDFLNLISGNTTTPAPAATTPPP